MPKDIVDRINDIADNYGYEHQRIKLIEELGELTSAVARNDIDNIVEECADVTIMIQQVLYLLKKNTHSTIVSKVERQERRIENE
jgi:NTP pyrophosphatase (non-canonical NTP hydrolase)